MDTIGIDNQTRDKTRDMDNIVTTSLEHIEITHTDKHKHKQQSRHKSQT